MGSSPFGFGRGGGFAWGQGCPTPKTQSEPCRSFSQAAENEQEATERLQQALAEPLGNEGISSGILMIFVLGRSWPLGW